MSNKYYYLVASLPYLKFDEAMPVTREEFLSLCGRWLNVSDLDRVAPRDTDRLKVRAKDPQVLKEYKEFDLYLKEELSGIREARKEDSRESIPLFFKDIFEEETPLLMEKNIEKKRWDFLEEREAYYHFDVNSLILYFLKLRILERLASFDRDKGMDKFEKLCEVNYE